LESAFYSADVIFDAQSHNLPWHGSLSERPLAYILWPMSSTSPRVVGKFVKRAIISCFPYRDGCQSITSAAPVANTISRAWASGLALFRN